MPPPDTLAVENREHLIALAAMLGVALLVSWLSDRGWQLFVALGAIVLALA